MSRAADGDSTVFWVWLQQKLGFASRSLRGVIEQPGSARFIYERTEDDLWALGIFPPPVIERMRDRSLDGAREIMDSCERLGIDIITPDMRLYPRRLLGTADPPAVLYVRGQMPNIDQELCIAVVGTRKASAYGAAMAQDIAGRLTESGCFIISGAARGIDTAAHQGALMCRGGRTAAVLGCGINYPYNMRGAQLREVISAHGALISEYPPDYQPTAHTFPIRNRIISGISLGVIVVEAGRISGSLNTAYHAVNQSRDVYAVAPSIMPYNSDGIDRLLSEGAESVMCPIDVLRHYSEGFAYKLDISDDCSENFMHGITRTSFSGSLSDVSNRFGYVFGCCCDPEDGQAEDDAPEAAEGAAAEPESDKIPGGVPAEKTAVIPDIVSAEENGETSDVKSVDVKSADIKPADKTPADAVPEESADTAQPDDSADMLIDRLMGIFIPAWRVPVPGGFPDDIVDGAADDAAAGVPEKPVRGGRNKKTSAGPDAEREEPPADAGYAVDAINAAAEIDPGLSEDAARLYGFTAREPRSADELSRLSGIPFNRLPSLLTELELYGLITACSGKRYSRKE